MSPSFSLVDRLWHLGLWLAYRMLRMYWIVVRPRHRGALVALWYRGRVLLVRNSYQPWLVLPGGSVKTGESSAAAALREMREEVGIALKPAQLRFVTEIPSRFEYMRDHIAFFTADLTDDRIQIDKREVIWAQFVEPEQALKERLAPPVREYLEGVSEE